MTQSQIDGHTQLVGLIGWPVEHSLSPAMHNAAFKTRGLNWRYVPLPVPPGQAEAAVRGLAALGLRGANVTVPHKRAVTPALDDISANAQTLGAVNTIVVERDGDGETKLVGHNTDAAGFIGALRDAGFKPEGRSAVVVGAGGAARAVVFGLAEADADQILVLNRTLERAQALASDLQRGSFQPRALPLTTETLLESARAADLLVNATPVGMWPETKNSIWPESAPFPPHLTLFDVIYNPPETRLMRQARESDARAIGGLEMLVRQGALAFEIWADGEAPIETMRAACRHNLPGEVD